MTIAYSYLRFSTPEQSKGDSKQRQNARYQEICAKHSLEPATRYFFDEGRSAYKKGKQRDLEAFVELVRSKQITAGSWLVIENLDRLSRRGFWDIADLIRDLLKSGIVVATTTPERIFNKQSINDMREIISMAVDAERAKSESDIKSERVKSAWRKKLASANNEIVTKRGPAWLTCEGDKWAVIPERVKVIKQIFKMASERGLGQRAIAKRLNSLGIPAWRGESWGWAYVRLILTDKRVIGTFTTTAGEFKNYYPQIIDGNLFRKVQALTARRTRFRGNTSQRVSNLFSGLAFADDGSTMVYVKKAHDKPARFISSRFETTKETGAVSFPYEIWEKQFLRIMADFTVADIGRPSKSHNSQLSALENKINKIDIQIAKTQKAMERLGANPTAAVEVLAKLEQAKHKAATELETIKANQQLTTPNEALNASKTILQALENASGQELVDIRLQLRESIRAMVKRITVALTKKGWETELFAKVEFHTGEKRRLEMVVTRGELDLLVADSEKWRDREPDFFMEQDGRKIPRLDLDSLNLDPESADAST